MTVSLTDGLVSDPHASAQNRRRANVGLARSTSGCSALIRRSNQTSTNSYYDARAWNLSSLWEVVAHPGSVGQAASLVV